LHTATIKQLVPTKNTSGKVTMKFSILDFGAVGDGVNLDTQAIQAAIDKAEKNGGGQVVVPAGNVFLTGSIQVKANVELHLEKGATLLGSSNYEHYSQNHNIKQLTRGLVDEYVLPQRALIVGFQAHGFKMTGEGTLSGNADGFIETRGQYIHEMRSPENGRSQYLERPFTIFLIDSQNVSLTDFSLTDPAFWAIRVTGCNDLVIDNIKILTDLMVPNADGIDIDRCQRVRIANCYLETADDCISLKSCSGTASFGDVSDILIENCVMISTSGAITLGTESVGDIKKVLVRNCEVKKSHRGFAVRSREGGTISDVVFENSKLQTRAFSPMWWGHGEALHVTAFAWNTKENLNEGNPERLLPGKVRNITFRNLEVDSEAGILNWAASADLVDGVSYENIQLSIGTRSKWPHRIDLRPNDLEPMIERPHNAFEAVRINNLSVDNLSVQWDLESREEYGQLIYQLDCPNYKQGLVLEKTAKQNGN
jgi:polygalacturonase